MITKETTTTITTDDTIARTPRLKVPALLVAYSPKRVCVVDRCRITLPIFSVGRRHTNDFALHDTGVSNTHFQIIKETNGFTLRDVDSKNGTFLNGRRVFEPTTLMPGDIIRAGQSVLVFETTGHSLFEPPPPSRYGMSGPFHVAAIIDSLKEAVLDDRHLLIIGETGVGKELAAHAIATLINDDETPIPILAHNCAQYGSEEEANTSLLGVGMHIFTNVDRRPGLIEQAQDGILFLDEANYLPPRVQKSLLRLIEDQQYKRIGETRWRKSNARIMFASNEINDETAGLIHDLYPRLRVVEIPSLQKRVADIPIIFRTILHQSLTTLGIAEDYFDDYLIGVHFEQICLAGSGRSGHKLKDNVRGLKDLARRLATKAANNKSPADTVNDIFSERFSSPTVCSNSTVANRYCSPNSSGHNAPMADTDIKAISRYEQHKSLIIETYIDREMKISPTVRVLKNKGLNFSRQHLSRHLKRWGVRK